jgi:hypothetical protein
MTTPDLPPVLYLIHCQDAQAKAMPGVEIRATSPNGNWAGTTDCAGNFAPTLASGHYSLTFWANGVQLKHDGSLDPAEWDLAWPPSAPILVGLEKGASVFPAIPTRAQVCGLSTSLAGLTYQTTQYGPIPAWFYGKLNAEDRAIARAAHRAAGDTHIPIPISEAYKESGTLWPAALAEGYDWTQDLATMRDILTEAICDGFFIDCPLAGDGMGAGPDYNDPVGNTYGQQWLMENLQRIVESLQGKSGEGQDLTPYMIFRPGWDGVFYGWGIPGEVPDLQPTRVKDFGALFRSVLPNGYLAIEHTPGNIPCGEGGSDYAAGGLMTTYDTILSEFNTVHEDSCWQVVARMVPDYHRPPDQPAGDDPHPPFYLAPGNPRGPYFYVGFEPTKGGVYQWCRGQCSEQDVVDTRNYLKALGCAYTG